MRPPPEDFRLLRFNSDDFPPELRLAGWREILNRTLLKFEIEPLAEPFYVDAGLRILPGLRFGTALFGPSASRRTAEIAASDPDGFYIVINLEGPLEVSAGGTEVTLSEREGIFLSCAQASQFVRHAPGRLMCLRCETRPLETILPEPNAHVGAVLRRGNESLRLFTSYLRALDDNQSLITPELRKIVIGHVYSLLALAVKLSQAADVAAQRADAAATRLRTVKQYIVGHFKNPDLDLLSVARATAVSPRQVQRLFETDSTTFSQLLLTNWLQGVHAALVDRLQVSRGISDIALDNGFRDISSFNRAFRNHFGVAPGVVRKAAMLHGLSAD